MGELVFIGLGLHDELGLSLRGREEAGSCDLLFLELYTSVMPGLHLHELSKLVGKDVRVLSGGTLRKMRKRLFCRRLEVERSVSWFLAIRWSPPRTLTYAYEPTRPVLGRE